MSRAERSQIWRRRANESHKVYEYFLAYLSLPPPRKVKELMTKVGVSEPTLRNYMAKYRWLERAEVYDAPMSKEAISQYQKNLDEAEHYLAAAVRFRESLEGYLRALMTTGDLGAREAVTLYIEIMKLENQAEKQIALCKEGILETEPELDMTRLSDAELDNLEQILRKAGNGHIIKTWGHA